MLKREFNQTQAWPPMLFKWLRPKDGSEFSKKFHEQYGGLFHPKAGGTIEGNPAIVMSNCNDDVMVVEKREDGIYLDEKFYCKEW
jgi:hypothetical protein